MEGSKEDVEAVRAFFQTCAPEASATRCWWSETSAGIIRAIADCFRDRRASAAWRIDRNPPPRVPTRPAAGIQDVRQRLLPGAVAGDRPVLAADVRADGADLRRWPGHPSLVFPARFWSDSLLMCRIWMAFDRRQDLAKISLGPRGSDSTCCALRSPVPYPPSRLLRFQPLPVH